MADKTKSIKVKKKNGEIHEYEMGKPKIWVEDNVERVALFWQYVPQEFLDLTKQGYYLNAFVKAPDGGLVLTAQRDLNNTPKEKLKRTIQQYEAELKKIGEIKETEIKLNGFLKMNEEERKLNKADLKIIRYQEIIAAHKEKLERLKREKEELTSLVQKG